MGVLKVINRCCSPRVRADDVLTLVLSNEILDGLYGHALTRRHFDLEVGALVLELLV